MMGLRYEGPRVATNSSSRRLAINMDVLVLGCGSIARRHINNLVKLPKVRKVFVCTKSKKCFNALDNYSRKIFAIEDIWSTNFSFVLICNKTYRHLDNAIKLAEKGINIFVEKPLSNGIDNVMKLKRIIERKRIKFMLGYNLRFLGAIKFIKEKLDKKYIGDLYFARIAVGQYLPEWRKAIDYLESYSVRRSKGGGVSFDLSHEIDYMRYFFGDPMSWKVIKTRVSNLTIDSEDVFEGVYLYKNKFICSVHMDYLEPKKRRITRIVGSKGIIIMDLVKEKIRIKRKNEKEIILQGKKYFNLNKTYVDELNDFIASLGSKKNPSVTIYDGIRALELLQDKNV
jgi:predicted dehydrogenase